MPEDYIVIVTDDADETPAPIALLNAKIPVVTTAISGTVHEKVLSDAQEAADTFDTLIPVPYVDELLSPILTVIPLQLLAYHIAA